MKLTSVGPEGARNLMREKQRRNRMAAKELRVQFPQFATIRVEVSPASARLSAAPST